MPAAPPAARPAPAKKSASRPRTKTGVVTSAARDRTRTVSVAFTTTHPKYGKQMRRQTVLQVHDEKNEAKNGDTVEIAECRPLSKTKRWTLVSIIRRSTAA
jgi:small subunit ribosomal protein S17